MKTGTLTNTQKVNHQTSGTHIAPKNPKAATRVHDRKTRNNVTGMLPPSHRQIAPTSEGAAVQPSKDKDMPTSEGTYSVTWYAMPRQHGVRTRNSESKTIQDDNFQGYIHKTHL